MIKKYITLVIAICSATITLAQQKNIEFKVDKQPKKLIVTGFNNTPESLEITLTIKDIKMLKGYSGPISKVVPANSKVMFIELSYEYDFYKYKLSFTYKKLETEAQKKMKAFNKEAHYLKDLSKINEGIVLFDDTGCGNCRLVKNYLVANDIDFKIIDLSQGKDNTKFMWKTVKEKGASMKVKLPVIVVDGTLTHSHKDLKTFLERLKK